MKSSEKPDLLLIGSVAIVLMAGLLTVYSASGVMPDRSIFTRQLVSVAIGVVFFIVGARIPLRILDELAPVIYLITCILLLFTVFFGGGPAGRWVMVGSFRFQPSEIAKVSIILLTSRWLSSLRTRPRKYGEGILMLVLGVSIILTWLQPDLGTAVSMCIIVLGMFYWAGYGFGWIFLLVSPLVAAVSSISLVYWLLFTGLLVIVLYRRKASSMMWAAFLIGNTAVAALTPFAWNLLRPYQQARLITFLNPAADPHGAGWNTIQSEVAIGSGGLFGQGFLHGSQKGLAFLPARHTDFVFSVWAEEFGFAGSIFILSAFFLIIWRIVVAGRKSVNPFNSILVSGIASYIAIHVILNVGMTLGIMPVTGLPLLLASFGGSHIIMALFLLGLALNVGMTWRIY